MTNFKKTMLTSVLFAGMAIGTAANAADPSAVVTWTGKIPAVTAGDTLLITGMSGSLDPVTGVLSPNVDGTFISESLILEAHANTGDATAPVVGALTDATWTLKAADIQFGGAAQIDQVAEVTVGGEVLAVDASTSVKSSSVGVSIAQTAPLAADVSGLSVQAAVTLMASEL
ncbi:hypothetical protein ACPV47_24445 [Vibrio jasicida]|uniref:hypothetical protein n=1 Tax=Vibrio jasicida TaxID=766224 RepID=UPI0040691842